jgi:hypothetical protein
MPLTGPIESGCDVVTVLEKSRETVQSTSRHVRTLKKKTISFQTAGRVEITHDTLTSFDCVLITYLYVDPASKTSVTDSVGWSRTIAPAFLP